MMVKEKKRDIRKEKKRKHGDRKHPGFPYRDEEDED